MKMSLAYVILSNEFIGDEMIQIIQGIIELSKKVSFLTRT